MPSPRRQFDTDTEIIPRTVTITDARGDVQTMTVDEFRRSRGLVQCQTCFSWDTPQNLRGGRRRHSCRYASSYVRSPRATGVDAWYSDRHHARPHRPAP